MFHAKNDSKNFNLTKLTTPVLEALKEVLENETNIRDIMSLNRLGVIKYEYISVS